MLFNIIQIDLTDPVSYPRLCILNSRVSLTIKKFKTSSSTFTEILFKHHLVEFMKKNCKVMVKKQCKRAKTIFPPAQGRKWAGLAANF